MSRKELIGMVLVVMLIISLAVVWAFGERVAQRSQGDDYEPLALKRCCT
jgi:hypothetical protein